MEKWLKEISFISEIGSELLDGFSFSFESSPFAGDPVTLLAAFACAYLSWQFLYF